MKLLCLHAERFSYSFDHPVADADEHRVGQTREFDDALVVFVAIEPEDGEKINHAAKEIRHAARRAGAANIVINPFVHLTSEPAPPEEAHRGAERLATRLVETFEGEVAYTSFGWYKSFRIDVRGDHHSQSFLHV